MLRRLKETVASELPQKVERLLPGEEQPAVQQRHFSPLVAGSTGHSCRMTLAPSLPLYVAKQCGSACAVLNLLLLLLLLLLCSPPRSAAQPVSAGAVQADARGDGGRVAQGGEQCADGDAERVQPPADQVPLLLQLPLLPQNAHTKTSMAPRLPPLLG
jgi:hypothetical protein